MCYRTMKGILGSCEDRCGSLWIVVDRCHGVVPGFSNYDLKSVFHHLGYPYRLVLW